MTGLIKADPRDAVVYKNIRGHVELKGSASAKELFERFRHVAKRMSAEISPTGTYMIGLEGSSVKHALEEFLLETEPCAVSGVVSLYDYDDDRSYIFDYGKWFITRSHKLMDDWREGPNGPEIFTVVYLVVQLSEGKKENVEAFAHEADAEAFCKARSKEGPAVRYRVEEIHINF